ncbi:MULTISPECIES: UDP-N-acetylmuramate--L-alanine ligase [Kamptonema]|uniref:UDP-N-acetylmuramate--L-alanine ligase n=1 Tax=Kamptonema TaxID=1501433 RepID=UPI0001DAD531|nr:MULTISPECIES: UDP-N-acetylmuramate--L-alanine ligase [Kamptonema]CBN58887.1 UDP-N-acetylmuramate--L-alanine ligase [Kamptonema sp. PCC 6506]
MPSSVDFTGRPFHFIGIGGIGMSALAYILAKRKLPIYGSDIKPSHITQRLQAMGAHIFWRQDASNFELFQAKADGNDADCQSSEAPKTLETISRGGGSAIAASGDNRNGKGAIALSHLDLPQVICSTAIHPANSEYRRALDLGCPIFHRSDVLAALILDYQSIAVAGTHGKTTTSSMIGFMLLKAGLDPTIVVGGEVNAWEGNARLGHGPYLVAEADESDGSLVKLSAKIGVVTNIELDHPDHYDTLDQVIATFNVFAQNCQILVGCIDCDTVKNSLKPSVSYSLEADRGADYTVDSVEYRADCTIARVWERGTALGEMQLKLLGQHNLSNALAAVAVGRLLGLEFAVIAKAIADFEGARRRFEVRGEHNGILFVDDYAHHPSEIRATLTSARLRIENSKPKPKSKIKNSKSRRVVAVFQPHRYSRTLTFLTEFAQSFSDADIVIVSDIYSAGEPNTGQISGEKLADLIAEHHQQVYYQPSLQSIAKFLTEILRPGDLALFLGAGNLNQIIPEVMAFYQEAPNLGVSVVEGDPRSELPA